MYKRDLSCAELGVAKVRVGIVFSSLTKSTLTLTANSAAKIGGSSIRRNISRPGTSGN